jgi:hypothetical protein
MPLFWMNLLPPSSGQESVEGRGSRFLHPPDCMASHALVTYAVIVTRATQAIPLTDVKNLMV